MKIKTLALTFVGAAAAAGALFFLPANHATAQGPDNDPPQVWDAFGGNQQAQKYSTATQITPDNVKNLKKAWDLHTGDVASGAHETTWGATPLFVNNTVYVGTPRGRIFAVEPDTGKHMSNSNPNGNPPGSWAKTGQIYKAELDGTPVGKFGHAGKLAPGFQVVHMMDCRNPNQIIAGEIESWRMQKFVLRGTGAADAKGSK